jgi:hypothetical protein
MLPSIHEPDMAKACQSQLKQLQEPMIQLDMLHAGMQTVADCVCDTVAVSYLAACVSRRRTSGSTINFLPELLFSISDFLQSIVDQCDGILHEKAFAPSVVHKSSLP